jgi:ribonuclease P protein subunit POP4
MTQDLLRREFIGKAVTVVDSKNPQLIGINGVVVDETKNTFLVKTKEKETRIPKDLVTIEVSYKGRRYRINGKEISRKPEDRIKR